MRTRTNPIALALAIFLAATAAALWAQQPGTDEREVPEACRQMTERHAEMQQRMQQMDRELATRVEQMNSARGDAKIDATAAVVNLLVEQRQTMRKDSMAMSSGTMGHMMGHMGGAGKGMADCPMMKDMMKGMDGRSGMQHPHGQPPQSGSGSGTR